MAATDEPVNIGSKVSSNTETTAIEGTWPAKTSGAGNSNNALATKADSSSNSMASAVSSFESLIQTNLDRHGDTSVDSPLSDQVLTNPGAGHGDAARELAIRANLSQGVSTVVNRQFNVDGQELKGPVSFNRQGDQFLIDQSSGKKYRVLEGDSSNPNGYLKPVGRDSAEQAPLAVNSVKTVGGFGGNAPDLPMANDRIGQTNARKDSSAPASGHPDGKSDVPKSQEKAVDTKSGADSAIKGERAQPVKEPLQEGVKESSSKPMTADEMKLLGGGVIDKVGTEHPVPPGDGSTKHEQSTPSTHERKLVEAEPVGGKVVDQRTERPDAISTGSTKEANPSKTGDLPVADAGKPAVDTGKPVADVGSKPAVDTGKPVADVGSKPAVDTGKPVADVGSKPAVDTGKPVADTGKPAVDTGKPVADVGSKPAVDTGKPVADVGSKPAVDTGIEAVTAVAASGKSLADGPKPISETGKIDSATSGLGAVRQQFLDVLNQAQAGKFTGDQNSAQFRAIQDLTKTLGPDGLAALRQNLQDAPAGAGWQKFDGFDPVAQQKIRDVIDTFATSSRAGDLAANSATRFDMERFVSGQIPADRLAANVINEPDTTRGVLRDLGKALNEYNTNNGSDVGQGLTVRDLISRSLEEPKPGLNQAERKDFTVNSNLTDEAINRALLERLAKKEQTDAEVRKADAALLAVPLSMPLNLQAADKPDVRDQSGRKPEDRIELQNNKELVQANELAQRLQSQRQADAVLDGQATNRFDQANIPVPEDLKTAQKHREEEKPRHKEDDHRPSQLELDAAAAFALANKKNKVDAAKDSKEAVADKTKKEEAKRQKYVVKSGDTLESIAGKMLRDQRLGALIFQINSGAIKTRLINGKQVPQLTPNMVIWLPTPSEIKGFRVRLATTKKPLNTEQQPTAEEELTARFGVGWDGNPELASVPGSIEELEDAAREAYKKRRANIESLLGPLSPDIEAPPVQKYVVRLGDTLKSVAVKHPSLQDVALWKLLAELNLLSTKTDERGVPLSVLYRGQTLVVPSVQEIATFRKREAGENPELLGSIELPTRSCPKCKRVTFASASICPGCGVLFGAGSIGVAGKTADKAATSKNVESKLSVPTNEVVETSNKKIVEHLKESVAAAVQGAQSPLVLANQLDSFARIMQSGSSEQLADGYKLQLEFNRNGQWIPVVGYEIFEDVALRHEYKPDGNRRTIRIDLPTAAAVELAANDVKSNWQTYCDKFAKTKSV